MISYTMRRIGLVISLAGFAISVNTLPSLVTWFSLKFSIPVASFGIIFLLQYGAFTVCSIIVGRLHVSHRLPLLGIVIGSLGVSSLCLFWIGELPSFIFLIVVMITIGGAGGVVESIGTTILTTSNGSNRMLYTSQFFYALGAFFAPVIVGFLLNLGVGIPNIGRVVGIFSFVLGTVVWLLVYQPWVGQDEDPQHKEGKIGSDLEEDNILSHVEVPVENKMISIGPGSNSPGLATFAFPFLFLTMISYVIIESAVGNWFAVYINEALAFSRADASFILSFYWVGLGVSRMFYMVIIIKNQSRTLLFQMGIMLMAVLLLLYSDMITNLSFLMVAVFILGFGCGPIWPLLIEYCSYLFAQEHLLMYLVGAGSIGALFGPIITSILFSIIGLERMNVLIFAYVLGMLLTTIVTIRIIKYNQSKINR